MAKYIVINHYYKSNFHKSYQLIKRFYLGTKTYFYL